MTEAIHVAELMDRFREASPTEEHIVPWQSIGLLAKPPQRNERPHSRLMRKPEDKVEPTNKHIDVGNTKRPVSPSDTCDAFEYDICVIATPPGNEAL